MKMPFGKYKGREIKHLPRSYLEWMVQHMEDKPDIVAEAKKALEDMKELQEQEDLERQADEILRRAGYRDLTNFKNIPRGYGRPIRRK